MKIEGPGPVRTGSVKRSGHSTGGAGALFRKQLAGDVAGTAGVAPTTSVHAVDSLLSLQEVDDPAGRASKGKKRAEDMLDDLDDLRDGLLTGTISPDKLAHLSRLAQTRRAQVDDPKLAEILDEIDLRAQVELAKLGQ